MSANRGLEVRADVKWRTAADDDESDTIASLCSSQKRIGLGSRSLNPDRTTSGWPSLAILSGLGFGPER
jgi:hypothetical protein